MTVSINGITCYAVNTRGTAQSYIRESVVTPNPNDVVDFDAWETAGGSAAGTQNINFDGTLVGGTDAGLVTATYTASIVMDGTTYPISIDATTSDTVTTIIGLINTDLPGTEMALVAGDLLVTSPTTGLESYVIVTDTDIFSGMTGFLTIDQASDGGLEGQLRAGTLDNGANGWETFGEGDPSSVEVYDPTVDRTKIIENLTDSTTGTVSNTLADVTVTPTQALINNNFASLAAKVDALQNKVEELLFHLKS